MNPSIQIKHISKAYGQTEALNDISFNVESGELFGLIGPDGAGKTTLFKIISSLLIPDSGEAYIENYHSVKDYKSIRRIIGYMPGKFSLYQDLSVEENLNFFATIFGTTIKANLHLIEDIYKQLLPFKKRRAGNLSGGMKQKLALCCALIHEPAVLLLDEPTTGVDAVSRSEFWDMLKRLQAKGITILVSTPYMDEAGLCDRIALIQEGKILSIDSPSNVVKGFNHLLYAVSSDNFYRLIKDLRSFPLATRVEAFGEYIHLSTDVQLDLNKLRQFLVQHNHNEIRIEQIEAGIEDVFLDLMPLTHES